MGRLRALLGLYPGYGLDSAETLSRHVYSVFATLAVLAVIAVGFKAGDALSRLLLACAFLAFVPNPFRAAPCKAGYEEGRFGGKPVITLSYKETGARFQELLKQEWGIGYLPVALLDHHLVAAGQSIRRLPAKRP